MLCTVCTWAVVSSCQMAYARTQVTRDTFRGIRVFYWAEDGKNILYLQVMGGVYGHRPTEEAGQEHTCVLLQLGYRGAMLCKACAGALCFSVFWCSREIEPATLQDKDGDEDWHLYAQPISSQGGKHMPARDLTPWKGVRAENLLLDRHHPSKVWCRLNCYMRPASVQHITVQLYLLLTLHMLLRCVVGGTAKYTQPSFWSLLPGIHRPEQAGQQGL